MESNDFNDKVTEFKRGLIRKLLNKCTESQKNLFNRMYKDIDHIEEKYMYIAYGQCKKTVEENND